MQCTFSDGKVIMVSTGFYFYLLSISLEVQFRHRALIFVTAYKLKCVIQSIVSDDMA